MKCYARVCRWNEEIDLVLAEMCRVLCYMDWRARYWQSFVSQCRVVDVALREGICAYANKQTHIMQAMALKFSQQWRPQLEGYSITPDWPVQYTSGN